MKETYDRHDRQTPSKDIKIIYQYFMQKRLENTFLPPHKTFMYVVTHYKATMNHLIMIILNLFFLSPTSANICDFPREESFEHNYYECQTYLMKWSVAALWMIAISLFIFALTVSMNRNLNSK